MHIANKNVIFNPFLSIFAGPHLKREKAQNLFNSQELKGINSKPKREPKFDPRIWRILRASSDF